MPVLEVYEVTTERSIPIDAPSPMLFCTPADPFEVDHDCLNPRGQRFVGDCGNVICVHCAKVAWS